jgi:hypothetical protein
MLTFCILGQAEYDANDLATLSIKNDPVPE